MEYYQLSENILRKICFRLGIILLLASPITMFAQAEAGLSHSTEQEGFPNNEIIPEFLGGNRGWESYIKKSMIYPSEAKKNRVEGRVILNFHVSSTGEISNIKVLIGLSPETDKEAIRLLQEGPKWKPGLSNGYPVDCDYRVQVFFRLPTP